MKNRNRLLGRRVCGLLLAVAAAFLLAGCGGKEEGTVSGKEQKEWIYVPEFLTIEDENISYYEMQFHNDRLYYISWIWGEGDESSSQNLCYYSIADRKVETVPLVWPEDAEDQGIGEFAIGEDGSLYTMTSVYSQEGEAKHFISKFDADGTWRFTKDITPQRGTEDNFYVQSMQVDREGHLYLEGNSSEIYLLDAEGNSAGTVTLGSGDNWISQLCKGSNGKVYVVYSSYDGSKNTTTLAEIDFNNRKLGNSYSGFPVNPRSVTPALEGGFLINDGDCIFYYDMERQEKTELLNWLDSDINGSFVESFGQLEDERILAAIQDWESNDNGIALLTRRKASEVPEKETITVATLSGGDNLKGLAVKFNRASDKYHIDIVEYLDYENFGENSWEDALSRLNNDITSGNCPDLLDLSGMNTAQLAAKGVFEDLNVFLEKSSMFSRSDFLENILEAYTYDDKLISIPGSFGLQTLVGHKSKLKELLGDKEGWTLQDMIEYADKNPDAELFDQLSKGEVLRYVMMMNVDEFIDWEEGQCSFDTDSFKNLLEFVNRYPDEVDWDSDEPVTPIKIQNGQVLLYAEGIYDFKSIQEVLDIFKNDAMCIGFPTVDSSSGHGLNGYNAYAILSKASNKEGAWAFIENILADESITNYRSGFPTVKSRLEAMASEAVEVKYVLDENGDPWLDENGEPVIEGSGGGIGWGDWFYEYHHTTQEEVDIVMEVMRQAKTMSYSSNDQIMSIILEDAEPFFKGQKTVEEVTGIIQNRVNIYINENR